MSGASHPDLPRVIESEKPPSWTDCLNAGFLALGRDGAAALRETLATRSLAGDIWIEKQGERTPIALALRPQMMDLASSGSSATRKGWSRRNAVCDDCMKLRSSSSGCETRPARGEPARVGSEPCDGRGNAPGDA